VGKWEGFYALQLQRILLLSLQGLPHGQKRKPLFGLEEGLTSGINK